MDKRRYRRLKDGVRVIYKVMGAPGESILPAYDIGGGGIRLQLSDRVKTGELLELGLILPEDPQPFFALAKIVWQSEKSEKNADGKEFFETGVQFLKLDIQNRMRLIKYVYSKVKERENEE